MVLYENLSQSSHSKKRPSLLTVIYIGWANFHLGHLHNNLSFDCLSVHDDWIKVNLFNVMVLLFTTPFVQTSLFAIPWKFSETQMNIEFHSNWFSRFSVYLKKLNYSINLLTGSPQGSKFQYSFDFSIKQNHCICACLASWLALWRPGY